MIDLLLKRAEVLRRLTMVEWDRCTSSDVDMAVYGWIARSDGQRDFVMVVFIAGSPHPESFATSSAKYSREIMRLLCGDDKGHIDCERVSDVFGDLLKERGQPDDLEEMQAEFEGLECTWCSGGGICYDGADPLGNCTDYPHDCHACHGSGKRADQTVF
jgi:hypothetical protein